MQRVSALLPSWDRSKTNSNNAAAHTRTDSNVSTKTTNSSHFSTNATTNIPGPFNKVFGWAGKISVPVVNRQSTSAAPPTRYGRETYWPTTLDKECDKAARILKSFCCDGYLVQEQEQSETPYAGETETQPPPTPKYVTKKIPSRIIQNAVGLAVFSCMRSGLWMSGSGGAGLITARKADGTWSPPSGIILHTAALGFVIGVDIYDCVLVINSVQTLEMFTRPKLILGTDVSLTVGPLVNASASPQEQDVRWKGLDDTVLTYVKARGKEQPVPLDGSLVSERGNENGRFYCNDVTVLDVLAGNIIKNIPEMRPLFEVIKAAEGRTDYDTDLMAQLAQQPAPGDAMIESPTESPLTAPKPAFGIPNADDPDPFGVIGLEMAGVEIREAGSRLRPTSTQFEYAPSPTSPLFPRFSRQSIDTYVSKSKSNRGSIMSSKTQATVMTDVGTQTDVASTAETSFNSRANSEDGRDRDTTTAAFSEKLPTVVEPEEIDYTQIDMSMIQRFNPTPTIEARAPTPEPSIIEESKTGARDQGVSASVNSPEVLSSSDRDEDADDEDDEEDDDDDEAIICEVATAAQPTRTSIRTSQVTQVIQAKGAIVTIPKRVPPPLPAKNPARTSRSSAREFGGDVSSLKSPLRSSFLSTDSRMAESVGTSEGTADTSPAETDISRKSGSVDLGRNETGKLRTSVYGHQKNSSSVYTAVDISERWDEEADDDRSPSPSQVPLPPGSPQSTRGEMTSSADDSEREPRTPRTEFGFSTARVEKRNTIAGDMTPVKMIREEGHTHNVNVQSRNSVAIA